MGTHIETTFEHSQQDSECNQLTKSLYKSKAHGNDTPSGNKNGKISLSADTSDDAVGGYLGKDIGNEEKKQRYVVLVSLQAKVNLHANDFSSSNVGTVDEGESIGNAQPWKDI